MQNYFYLPTSQFTVQNIMTGFWAERVRAKQIKNCGLEGEPRHDKTCLRESLTRPDTNRPGQPQKLATVLKFGYRI